MVDTKTYIYRHFYPKYLVLFTMAPRKSTWCQALSTFKRRKNDDSTNATATRATVSGVGSTEVSRKINETATPH